MDPWWRLSLLLLLVVVMVLVRVVMLGRRRCQGRGHRRRRLLTRGCFFGHILPHRAGRVAEAAAGGIRPRTSDGWRQEGCGSLSYPRLPRQRCLGNGLGREHKEKVKSSMSARASSECH